MSNVKKKLSDNSVITENTKNSKKIGKTTKINFNIKKLENLKDKINEAKNQNSKKMLHETFNKKSSIISNINDGITPRFKYNIVEDRSDYHKDNNLNTDNVTIFNKI